MNKYARRRLRLGGRRLMATLAAALVCAGSLAAKDAVFEGRLVHAGGGKVVLRGAGRDYEFGAAREPWLLHTLGDKRLEGRAVRVEGELLANGRLKVNHFWTVREGKLYRVRYFCELCNIETLEPGLCMCCQQETELQEIPLEEERR